MTVPFRIIIAVIFIAFIAHRAYYTQKHPPDEEDTFIMQEADRSSPLVTFLAIAGLVSLLLTLFAPGLIAWAMIPIPGWLQWLGVGVAAAGFTLLQWSQVTLGKNWSDTPRIMQRQQLVKEGPYRSIRHPIYTAFLLILGSPLLITGNLALGLSWLGMTALDVRARVQFEEAALTDHFGESYPAYKKRTGALLPRL